jgi:hypothetical protein
MNLRNALMALLGLLVFLAILVGCGGGGGSTATDTSQQVAFFVTDDLNTGYDHVWVTFHEVELEFVGGGSTKVFRSDVGVQVDLRALNTGTGNLFQFLGSANLPTQPVNKVKFQVAQTATLFTTGSTTGTVAQFPTPIATPAGRANLVYTPTTPITTTPGGTITIDFDLANWIVAGGIISPAFLTFTGSGPEDPTKQIGEDFHGVVSELSGTQPNQAMILTTASGQVMKVVTNSSTVILNSNGSPSPVLANGKRVEVRGSFIVAERALRATVIKVEDASTEDEDKVKGPVQNINTPVNQFEVKSVFVRGFVPASLWVKVQTNSTTRFFNRLGTLMSAGEFYTALAGGSAEVEGSYDPVTNTLTALKAKLEGAAGAGDYQEAKGPVVAEDAVAGTLAITLNEWSGFAGTLGAQLPISTAPNTEYRNADGQNVTKAQFFELVSTNTPVKVEGVLAAGTISAKRLGVRSTTGGGGNSPHDVNGYVSDVNPVAKTFKVTLVSWFGFSGNHGSVVTVTMGPGASYRNDNGDPIAETVFFESLQSTPLVEVDGLVSGSTMAGVKAKLDND